MARLGLPPDTLPDREDPTQWPDGKRRLAEILRTRPRDEWTAVFDGSDACVSPVLSLDEAPITRTRWPGRRSSTSAAPFSLRRHPVQQDARRRATAPPQPGADTEAVLRDWGLTDLVREATT
ncbi:putative alpha-methylacyl-CoA racemase domain protein [Mycobacterium xenopi 4042]|uniref:Putative alpha-methylacyl-CoA racemase domain protein n=1 Tax=Mycobacterium xenopi 4042 TaxID=1299334 RepID=X7ZVV0_MYCXE|nr:putative alpha-methylacyl-CoA racemase domain protein [Mycobacterium xenopi 4042]